MILLRVLLALGGSALLVLGLFYAVIAPWTLHDPGWDALKGSRWDVTISFLAGVGGTLFLIVAATGITRRAWWCLLGGTPAIWAAIELVRV